MTHCTAYVKKGEKLNMKKFEHEQKFGCLLYKIHKNFKSNSLSFHNFRPYHLEIVRLKVLFLYEILLKVDITYNRKHKIPILIVSFVLKFILNLRI